MLIFINLYYLLVNKKNIFLPHIIFLRFMDKNKHIF